LLASWRTALPVLLEQSDLASKSWPTFSAPFLSDLAQWLPELGEHLGDFFETITESGPGARMFFNDVLDLVNGTVDALGWLVKKGSKAYEFFSAAGAAIEGHPIEALTRYAAAIKGLDPVTTAFSDGTRTAMAAVDDAINRTAVESGASLEGLGLDADLTATQMKELATAVDAAFSNMNVLGNESKSVVDAMIGSMLGLDQASLGFDRSLITLGDTLTANQGQLSEHVKQLKKTETGAMQNKEAILGVVEANLREYDALIAVGFSAEDAAAKYDENTKALEDQMRAAGMTQEEIDGLIGKYRGVPDRVTTAIALEGLTKALNDLSDLLAEINHVARTHYGSVIITEEYRTSSPYAPGGSVYKSQVPGAYAHGGIVGAQGGGPRSGGTVVGEHGWELLDLAPGTRVHSHEDSVRMMSEMGGNAASEAKVSFDFTGADEEFKKFIRKIVRIDGGGNVQTAFGRN
jgi:hypothetical protein